MRSRVRVLITTGAATALFTPLALLGLGQHAAAQAQPGSTARAVVAASPVRIALRRVGTTSLRQAPGARRSTVSPDGFGPTAGEHFIATDPDNNSQFTPGGPHASKATLSSASGPAPISGNVTAGTHGFTGLTGAAQAAVNGSGDLEPPDQGLCTDGSSIVDDVNDALQVYSTAGTALSDPVAATTFFGTPASAFFADPRCYYDAPTSRWFFTQFDVATFKGNHETSPSVQYIAVSNSKNVLGSYSVYASDSDDSSTSGCPCFGDFDQIGADANGFYISTNEFGDISGAFNGSDIYAYSTKALETGSDLGAPAPQAVLYRLVADPTGQPYHVAPAATPPGGTYAKNTEYFVESNSNASKDDHLVVYALTDTQLLARGGEPTLAYTETDSEFYAFPPDATQPAGYRPLGEAVGEKEGKLQADFNAIQEVTYTAGNLYAEASTASVGKRDGIAWFILRPTVTPAGISAPVTAQGYVTSPGVDLTYPDIAVDASGHGYLVMSLTGSSGGTAYYPSAAYQKFGPDGPSGAIHLAAAGALPEDGFTCYAAFVGPGYGGCRWGDYSMGVAAAGRIFMATEYIPPAARDYYSNWGTYVWSSPTSG